MNIDEDCYYEATAVESSKTSDGQPKKKKPGIIHLSSLPPNMNVVRIQDYFSHYGVVTRVLLNADEKEKLKTKRKYMKYREGWIEFEKKSVAKLVCEKLVNQIVGGSKKNKNYSSIWVMKYMPRFKWANLKHGLIKEAQLKKKKLDMELGQVTKQTDKYIIASEINERLKKKKNTEEKDKSVETKVKLTKKEKDEKFQKMLQNRKQKQEAIRAANKKIIKKSIFTGRD